MIMELKSSELLIVFDRRYNFSEFKSASRAMPGSYADELVKRIYNCLFRFPKDLQKEYEDYYAVEYSTFGKFLYWKYKISSKRVQDIEDKIKDGTYVGCGRDTIGVFTDETVTSVLDNILSELGEKA